MSRLATRFSECRQRGTAALVPFITAGDPDPEITVGLMHALVDSGADVIELGVPFSDPMAEGPAIQHACERALAHHVNLHRVLDIVREFRGTDPATPVVVMGYLNPVEVLGYETFAAAAAQAGVDGVITVDLPPEEGADYISALRAHGLDPVLLLSPTTTDVRIERICAVSSGFVYYVALRGVTGAGNLDIEEVQARVSRVRGLTALPVGVGFGINSPEAAARVAGFADAVIVGSAIVKRIGALADQPDQIIPEVSAFLASLREAVDAVKNKEVALNP